MCIRDRKYAGPPYSLAQSGGQLAGENPLLAYLEEKGEVLLKTDLKGIAPQEKRELLLAEDVYKRQVWLSAF